MRAFVFALLALLSASLLSARADVSSSQNYSITVSSMDGGGLRSSSGDYAQIGVITPMAGFATESSLTVRFGFATMLNSPPLAADDLRSHPEGGAVDILATALLINDSDPDGDPLSLSSVDPVSAGGGSVIINGASIRYTPKSGFTGTDQFQYVVKDSNGDTATATVTMVTAPPVDQQPINSITFTKQADGKILIRFRQQPGWTEYYIEYTDDLKNREWQLLKAFPVGADGIAEILLDPPQGPATFFRGKVQ